MNKIIYFFYIVLLLLSCTSRTIYKKPKNLIEKDQMIDLWTDIYIAKGARTVKMIDKRKNINHIPSILEKYNIDSLRFSESNFYYTSRIDEYEKMFEEVQNRLKEIKKRYQLYPKKDSIMLLREVIEPEDMKNKKPRRTLLQQKPKN